MADWSRPGRRRSTTNAATSLCWPQDARRLIAAGVPLARAVPEIGQLGARPLAVVRRLQSAQRDRGVQRAGMAVASARARRARDRRSACRCVRRSPVPPAPACARDAATVRRPDRSPPASPRIASAWQRQPPKSISRSSQDRHGSGIQSVPRNAWNAGEFAPDLLPADGRAPTRTRRPGMVSAAWHGSTRPDGVTFSERRAQPPMHAFGRRA